MWVSVIYKELKKDKKYFTICGIPGEDKVNEYFLKQCCMRGNFEFISAKAESNPNRRMTREEKASGLIRKSCDFFNRPWSADLAFDD